MIKVAYDVGRFSKDFGLQQVAASEEYVDAVGRQRAELEKAIAALRSRNSALGEGIEQVGGGVGQRQEADRAGEQHVGGG